MPQLQDEVTILKPEALLKFRLYESVDRSQSREFGEPVWIDQMTALSADYGYGTKHTIEFPRGEEQSGTYISAMLPHLRRVDHDARPGVKTIELTVFLAPLELFAFMTPLDDNQVNIAYSNPI
ncbi:hypothetical protein A6C57_23275 [Fibrella sp. ES10-3-2-2]